MALQPMVQLIAPSAATVTVAADPAPVVVRQRTPETLAVPQDLLNAWLALEVQATAPTELAAPIPPDALKVAHSLD